MVQIAERARIALRRLLSEHLARPRQGVRLRLDSEGALGMTSDVPHPGDSVISRDNVPVLIVDSRLSSRLAKRLLAIGRKDTNTNYSRRALPERPDRHCDPGGFGRTIRNGRQVPGVASVKPRLLFRRQPERWLADRS